MAPQFEDWPCPDGWLIQPALVDENGEAIEAPFTGQRPHSICRPPQLPQEACPPGTIAQVGQQGCVPHGVACPPEGELWHDEGTIRQLAQGWEGRIWYVHPSGVAQGPGTRDAPALGVRDVLPRAVDGDIVALGRGVFTNFFSSDEGLAIVGSCVEETIVEEPLEGDRATITFSNRTPLLLSQMTVRGPRVGIQTFVDGPRTFSNLRIEGAKGLGIDMAGETHLDAVHVAGVEPEVEGNVAYCVQAASGVGTIRNAHFTGCGGIGVMVFGRGSELVLEDSILDKMVEQAGDVANLSAVQVLEGGSATLRRVLIDQVLESGLIVFGAGTSAEIEDVWVVGSDGLKPGAGLFVGGGARLEGRRVGIEDQAGTGLLTFAEGRSEVVMSDLWVSGVREAHDINAFGVANNGGSTVALTRAVLLQSHWGIYNISSTLTLEDAWIGAPSPDVVVGNGRQFGVVQLGEATLSRVALTDFVGEGLLTNADGESASRSVVEDLWVSDIRAPLDIAETFSRQSQGVIVVGLGELEVTRALIEGIEGNGVELHGEGAHGVFKDVHIKGSHRALPTEEEDPGGCLVATGARLEASRLTISEVEGFGIAAVEEGEVEAEDLWIVDGVGFGVKPTSAGIILNRGAVLKLSRALLEDNIVVGIATDTGSTLSLEDVRVAGTRPLEAQPPEQEIINGSGIFVNNSVASLVRVHADGNHEYGIFIQTIEEDEGMASMDTEVSMTDVHITDTLPRGDKGSFGLGVVLASKVTAKRLVLKRNNVAMSAGSERLGGAGRPVRFEVSDLWIIEGRALSGEALVSHGVLLRGDELEAVIDRAHLEQGLGVGIYLHEEARATISDLRIINQQEGRLSGASYGLLAIQGSEALVSRAYLENNGMVGVAAESGGDRFEGGVIEVSDLVVTQTTAADCSGCNPETPGGLGVYSADGGFLKMSRFEITESAQAGLLLLEGGLIKARDGALHDNRIGVNILSAEVDIDKDFENVRTFSNDRDFSALTIEPPTTEVPELDVVPGLDLVIVVVSPE